MDEQNAKKLGWIKFFKKIINQPHHTGIELFEQISQTDSLRIIAFAALIEAASTVAIAWLHRMHPGLVAENKALMAPWSVRQPLPDAGGITQQFAIGQAFLGSLATAFAGIFAFGAIVWGLHWLLTRQPRRLPEITALAALASGLYAGGTLITGLIEYITGSMRLAPHLGILINPAESPFLFAPLSRMNLFYLASYICAGYAAAGAAHVEKRYGGYISAVLIAVIIGFYALLSAAGAYLAAQLKS
jgi:hypothetical protein